MPYAEPENFQLPSLKENIQIGLKNNLKIQSALKEIVASEAKINKVRAGWLPHLYLNIDSDYNKTQFSQYQKSIEDVPSWVPEGYKEAYKNIFYADDSEKYTNKINIDLTQLLVDNGQVSTNISIAQIQYSIAKINLELIKKDLEYEISKNYYELFKYNKIRELNQKLVERKEEQLKTYEAKLKLGVITTPMLLSKKLEVLTAKNELIKIENAYETKVEEFLRLLNVDTLPKFNFDIIPEYIPCEVELDSAVSYALENNLKIQLQQLEVLLKKKDIDLASSGRKISATLGGNYGYERSDEDFKRSLEDFNKNWNVRISFVWPIFTGGEVISDIKASSNKYSQSQLVLKDFKKEIISNIRQKYRLIKNLEKQIQLLSESEKITQESLVIAQIQYTAKAITEDDLYNTQITLDEIILEKVKCLFDHQISRIEFCCLTGSNDLDKLIIRSEK
ncbi:MAG: TolC family protein [bacterium]|nr:TolC family protein [bacterium]